MRRKNYNTDITDAMWEAIQDYIPQEKPGGRPRDTDIREVVNGILYVQINDCSWRKMPMDLLPWQTVYDYYRKWRANGAWEQVVEVLEAYGVFRAVNALPRTSVRYSRTTTPVYAHVS